MNWINRYVNEGKQPETLRLFGFFINNLIQISYYKNILFKKELDYCCRTLFIPSFLRYDHG
jgi:hypothetical protein